MAVELKVQNYLRNGKTIQDLTDTYGVKSKWHSKYPNLVLLKYDMINSPLSSGLVQECRGLILDEADNWKVVCYTFKKFFNLGEQSVVTQGFDFDNFRTTEKVDGSLIQIYWYDNQWNFATSGTPDALGQVDPSGLTFRELINKAILDMGYPHECEFTKSLRRTNFCYAFELQSPENQVVVYSKDRKLTLLMARDLDTFEEQDIYGEWTTSPVYFSTPEILKADYYKNWTLENAMTCVRNLDGKEHEGYVLVDRNFNRCKMKNDVYVLLGRGKDTFQKSPRACVALILTDGVDDVKHLLPDFIQERLTLYAEKLQKMAKEIDELWASVKHIEDKKEFAMAVQHHKYGKAMFSLKKYGINSGADYIRWYCTDHNDDIKVNSKAMDYFGIYDKEVEE